MANELGLKVVPILVGKDKPGTSTSRWELLTTNQPFLEDLAVLGYPAKTGKEDHPIQLWTDDYSNLFQILR
jgi:hypothetical protein